MWSINTAGSWQVRTVNHSNGEGPFSLNDTKYVNFAFVHDER